MNDFNGGRNSETFPLLSTNLRIAICDEKLKNDYSIKNFCSQLSRLPIEKAFKLKCMDMHIDIHSRSQNVSWLSVCN